jgi:hypothetical protein
MPTDETINVRYMVDNVDDAIDFYTKTSASSYLEGCAGIRRRVELGSCSRDRRALGRPMTDGTQPGPVAEPHPLHVDDLDAEVRGPAEPAPPSATTSSRTGRQADPPGPLGELHRAVLTGLLSPSPPTPKVLVLRTFNALSGHWRSKSRSNRADRTSGCARYAILDAVTQ